MNSIAVLRFREIVLKVFTELEELRGEMHRLELKLAEVREKKAGASTPPDSWNGPVFKSASKLVVTPFLPGLGFRSDIALIVRSCI